jgi:transketolase
MSAPKFDLNNLNVIIDYNNGQIDGPVNQVMPIEPIKAKLESFHWETRSIDGHNLEAIDKALSDVKNASGRPQCIIAQTVKGKSVSFMEHNIGWHGNAPKKEDADKAVAEILGASGRG